jgi:hypothetical protein
MMSTPEEHPPAALQTVDRAGLGVSWGVPFIVAAVAMILAGVVIGFYTIKGEPGQIARACTRALLEWRVSALHAG